MGLVSKQIYCQTAKVVVVVFQLLELLSDYFPDLWGHSEPLVFLLFAFIRPHGPMFRLLFQVSDISQEIVEFVFLFFQSGHELLVCDFVPVFVVTVKYFPIVRL